MGETGAANEPVLRPGLGSDRDAYGHAGHDGGQTRAHRRDRRSGEGSAVGGSDGQVIAQIERIFRYVHVLATATRNEMIRGGRGEELDERVREAHELQAELKKERPD